MSMSRSQLQGLATLAEAHWLSAVAYAHGYECHLKNSLSRGTWLNRLTIICAVLTAGSTIENLSLDWLPIVTGLLTAAVASIEKVLAPSARGVEYADIIKKLEVIQSNIAILAIRIESIQSFSAVQSSLTAILADIQEARRIPITLTNKDSEYANDQLRHSTVASLTSRLAASISPEAPPPPAGAAPPQPQPQPRGPQFDDGAPSFVDMTEPECSGMELPADAPNIIGTARRQHAR